MSAREFLRNTASRFDLKVGTTADGLDVWDHGVRPDPTGTLRTGSLDEPDPSARATRLAAVISSSRGGVMVRIPSRHLDDVNVLVRAGVEGSATLLDGLVTDDGYACLMWSDRAVTIEPSMAQVASCRVRELIGDSVDRAEEARASAEMEVARLQNQIVSHDVKVEKLAAERDAAEAKAARLSVRLADLKRAHEECATLQDEIEAYQKEISELTVARDGARAELVGCHAQIAELEASYEAAAVEARELTYARFVIEELRAQNHRLQRTLTAERKRAADLDAKRRENFLKAQHLQAEKQLLQSSGSYRFGRILADALRSPRNFIAIPVRLLRLMRDLRQDRTVATSLRVAETAKAKLHPAATTDRNELIERLAPQPLEGDVAFVPSAMLASMLPPGDSRILEPVTAALRIRNNKPRLLLIDDHCAGAGTPWAGCLRGPSEGDDSRLRETIDAAKSSGCRIVVWHTDSNLPAAAFRELFAAADRVVHTSVGDGGADVATYAIPYRMLLDPTSLRIWETLSDPMDPWANLIQEAFAADMIRRAELLLDACLETSIARFLDEPHDSVLPRCRVFLVANGGSAMLTSYHVASGLRARGYEPQTVSALGGRSPDAAEDGNEDRGELIVRCDTQVTARAVLMLLAWSVVRRAEHCALFLRDHEIGSACAVLRMTAGPAGPDWPASPAGEDLVLDQTRGAVG